MGAGSSSQSNYPVNPGRHLTLAEVFGKIKSDIISGKTKKPYDWRISGLTTGKYGLINKPTAWALYAQVVFIFLKLMVQTWFCRARFYVLPSKQ